MSAVERLEDGQDVTPERPDPDIKISGSEALLAPPKDQARLRPLLALAPYVARYRARAILALVSLAVAAFSTLVVPVAVRGMIELVFTLEGNAVANSYFTV